jgi:hypothetical protein
MAISCWHGEWCTSRPFPRDGVIPDRTRKQHMLPSRLLIGELLECLICNTSAISEGEDGVRPFNSKKTSVVTIARTLHDIRYDRNGNEVFTNVTRNAASQISGSDASSTLRSTCKSRDFSSTFLNDAAGITDSVLGNWVRCFTMAPPRIPTLHGA